MLSGGTLVGGNANNVPSTSSHCLPCFALHFDFTVSRQWHFLPLLPFKSAFEKCDFENNNLTVYIVCFSTFIDCECFKMKCVSFQNQPHKCSAHLDVFSKPNVDVWKPLY